MRHPNHQPLDQLTATADEQTRLLVLNLFAAASRFYTLHQHNSDLRPTSWCPPNANIKAFKQHGENPDEPYVQWPAHVQVMRYRWFMDVFADQFDFDTIAQMRGNILICQLDSDTYTPPARTLSSNFLSIHSTPPHTLWFHHTSDLIMSWVPKKFIYPVQHAMQKLTRTSFSWIHLFTPFFETMISHSNPPWHHLPKTNIFLEPSDNAERVAPMRLIDFATTWCEHAPID